MERKPESQYTKYIDLGLRFAMSIILTAGGGYWLDSKIDTSPLFFVVGMFWTLYKTVYPSGAGKGEEGEGKD